MSIPRLKRIKSEYQYNQLKAPICWAFVITRMVCHIIKRYTNLGDECAALYTYPEIAKILLYDDPSFLHTYTPDNEAWMLIEPTEPMEDSDWANMYISRCSENGFKTFLLFCAIFRLAINYRRIDRDVEYLLHTLIVDLLNNKKSTIQFTLNFPTEQKNIDNQSVFNWNIKYMSTTIKSIFNEFYENYSPTFTLQSFVGHKLGIAKTNRTPVIPFINKIIQSLQSNFYVEFSPNYYVINLIFFIRQNDYSFDNLEYIELFLNPSIVDMYDMLKNKLYEETMSTDDILMYLEKEETIGYIKTIFAIDEETFWGVYKDLKLFFKQIDNVYNGHAMMLRDVVKNGKRILFECFNSHGEHYSYYIPLSFLEKAMPMIELNIITDNTIQPQTILYTEKNKKKPFVAQYVHDWIHTGLPIIPITASSRVNAIPMRRQKSNYDMKSSFQVHDSIIGTFKTGRIRDDHSICKLYCLSRMVLHSIKKYISFGAPCDYSYSNLYAIFKDQLSKEELHTFPIENMINPHASFEFLAADWRWPVSLVQSHPKRVKTLIDEWEEDMGEFSFNYMDTIHGKNDEISNQYKEPFIQAQLKKKYKCDGSSFSELLLFADLFRLFQKIEREPVDEPTKIKYITSFVSGMLGNRHVNASISNQNEWRSIYIQDTLKKTMTRFYKLTQVVKFSVHYIVSNNLSFIQPVLESDSYIVLETQDRVSDMIFNWLEQKYSEAIFLSISSTFDDKIGDDPSSHFWIIRQWKDTHVECIHSHLDKPFDLPILFLQRVTNHVSFYMISDSPELYNRLQSQYNPDFLGERQSISCHGQTRSSGQCMEVETYGKQRSKRLRMKRERNHKKAVTKKR